MQTFSEALSKILSENQPIAKKTETPLESALGRIVSADVMAPISVPSEDNSAMDGFVLHTDTWQEGKKIPVSKTIAAGEAKQSLATNTAGRIFTGAIIPESTNCVVPQELCEYHTTKTTETTETIEKWVQINTSVKPNDCIRPVGEDFKQGDILLAKGERVSELTLGLIANAGIGTVMTYEPLTVALLSTGDELLQPGEPWQSGKVYDSNRPAIASILKRWGFVVNYSQVIPDDLQRTQEVLQTAAQHSDVIITCGGVSVGERDFLRAAVDKVGHIDTWKIKMKPGKPLALGKVADKPYIGLPGNPVSAVMSLLLLGRPCLMLLQGGSLQYASPAPIPIQSPVFIKANQRSVFHRVKLDLSKGFHQASYTLYTNQNSNVSRSLQWCDGFIHQLAGCDVQEQQDIDYLPLNQLLN